jgi:hypothetical protein
VGRLSAVVQVAKAPAAAQTAAAPQAPPVACDANLTKTLAGAWKAPQYKMKRASEVGAKVFGADSYDIRNIDLTLEPSGEGVLKIATSVLDQKGKTWAPTLIEAKLMVGAPKATGTGRCEPAVSVSSIEEQYLDQTNYRTPLPGSRVVLVADTSGKQLEMRFETPKGEGSFWSTLTRQAPRPAAAKSSTN